MDLNLINLFGFYLAVMLLLSTARRVGQYRDVARLLWAFPARWPKLLKLVGEHRTLFLTWTTLRPLLFALGLTLLHGVASRIVWPQARLTLAGLADDWWAWPALMAAGLPMLAVDLWFVLRVGTLDHTETTGYLDQAEHWLTTWKAPVVKLVTFGLVNPVRTVGVEVRKALQDLSSLLNQTLWWVTAQVGLRLLFGLTLWSVWAIQRP